MGNRNTQRRKERILRMRADAMRYVDGLQDSSSYFPSREEAQRYLHSLAPERNSRPVTCGRCGKWGHGPTDCPGFHAPEPEYHAPRERHRNETRQARRLQQYMSEIMAGGALVPYTWALNKLRRHKQGRHEDLGRNQCPPEACTVCTFYKRHGEVAE